jgi:enoyl-CoA hydratase/carnithine racemase
MVLTGRPIAAERLYELGGLNRLVPKGGAVKAALEMAAQMAALPPVALAGMKQMLTADEDLHLTAALENDQAISQKLFADPLTVSNMAAFQKRIDAGEALSAIYWPEN